MPKTMMMLIGILSHHQRFPFDPYTLKRTNKYKQKKKIFYFIGPVKYLFEWDILSGILRIKPEHEKKKIFSGIFLLPMQTCLR